MNQNIAILGILDTQNYMKTKKEILLGHDLCW